MIRSLLTVSSGTLASRLLGYLRDSMIAGLLGTGAIADAFLVAFQFVNVVRRLLSEGALNAALVPAWMKLRETSGAAAAASFAGAVLGTISAALIVAALVLGLLMPLVVTALAPGFAGHDTLQLAVTDARLMLPYLAFAGPATVLLALASAQGRFFVTAFSPLLFNVALIAVMTALIVAGRDAGFAALALAATVGIAGLLQLGVLLLRSGENIATPLRVSVNAEMRSFFARAVPGMVASAGPQLLAISGAIIASSSPSAVSWLYFANRLIELPLGMVGVAMGTVLIPELTRAVHDNDRSAIAHAESRALELAAGLALPAMLGLIALSEPIVRLLFEHGAFTAADTASTAQALIWLALGLPAHVLVKALSPAFFAREDTWTPLLATLKGFVFATALALLLGHFAGVAGIAIGLAFGAWSTASSLIRQGATSFGLSLDADARRRLPRIVAAALVMGGLLWLASGVAANAHGLAQAMILLALIAGGIGVYGLLLLALRVTTWDAVINASK
jgi:putative peptidoglycan lipid II flippase